MITSLCVAAWLACAPFCGFETAPQEPPPPTLAASKIDSVTVYRGQALVTREVTVPEGEGTLELVVGPLPFEVVQASLYTEGTEGFRVLSTRPRVRTLAEDTRKEARVKEERIKTLKLDNERLQKAIEVHRENIQFLQKLQGFSGVALNNLADKGRIESQEIIKLTDFLMQNRATKGLAEVELGQRVEANKEESDRALHELQALANGSTHTVAEGVIVVQKSKADAGTVRFSYLVNSADWLPQYRLRGTNTAAPVGLEYLAAVHQQSGESWTGVRLTLSNAKPSFDSAPPELLPLNIVNSAEADLELGSDNSVVGTDDRSQKIAAELQKTVDVPFSAATPLEAVLKYVRTVTTGPLFPEGIPIYTDPVGLSNADVTVASPITFDVKQVALKTSLKLMLKQLGLDYEIKNGLLIIKSKYESGEDIEENSGAGAGGMGDVASGGFSLEQAQGKAMVNHAAATDQAQELRMSEGRNVAIVASEKDTPSVTFHVEGRLDVPSRPDPQLIEVARLELPSEYYAKAVPVLTPRVYRLAKLTNASEQVLLPGEATVYVGTDFVGRMRLPLVAAGEPFIAGFGVDPQIQVSRRLVEKSKTIQGGNQIYTYEFRIGLRNYQATQVKVQLWDRLPKPDGEAVAVNLVKTSLPLSADPLYLRSSRLDNLLQWDIDLPAKTIGDKTLYLNYEFRLEYARDLATPKFDSGGLREGPIGGGAMGGMGGGGMGGGGFR